MKDKKTEKQLSQLYFLTAELQTYEQRLEQIREGKLCPNYSKVGSNTTNMTDRTGKSALAAIQLEQTIENIKTRLLLEEVRLRRQIDALDDSKMRKLFILRYIEGRKWNEVSFMMNYSVDNIYKLHSQGIKIIEKSLQ